MCCVNMEKARLGNEIMTLKKNDIADHLNAAIKDGDASAFPPALGNAVRAFGRKDLRDATCYSRQKIYRATRPDTNPRFETVHDVTRGMGLAIRFVPAKNGQAEDTGDVSDESE
jgi:probable addiction module antidote protein